MTLADVASFAPAAGEFGMEPHGWAVVNRPANFVGGSSSQVKSGTVLDTSVQVRFTAVRYEVDFGDGAHASFTGQGKTWTQLGLPMFAPTPTSHVYAQRGTFHARVSAVFRAEFSTGGAWIPIDGELTLAPQNLDVLVVDASSALVSKNCHHGAPGCP